MAKKEWTPEERERYRQMALERHAKAKAEKEAAAAAPKEDVAEPASPFEGPQIDGGAPDAAAGTGSIEPAERRPLKLSEEQRERIRAEARKKVEAELAKADEAKLKRLMADELDKELLAQRREAGLTDYQDDIIEFMCNCPPFATELVVDGKVYQHGHWYKLPRRQYDSIRDMMAQGWGSEDRAGNPNRKYAAERQMLGTINPMMAEQRLPDGSFTIGLDTRVHGRSGGVLRAPSIGG